ncbi:MAG TPA: hypothetical protein VG013_07885 [Gemmataceae bacterium]|jgi:hypothetical protein|nr:hypothetical protein [Gemmataceae bacterium]
MAKHRPLAEPGQSRAWGRVPAAVGLVAVCVLAVAGFAYVLNTAKTPERPAGGLDDLCAQFQALKNSGDPAANDLLTPVPAVPAAPVSEEEADYLDTQFIVRERFEIIEVRPQPGDPDQRILVCKGNGSSQKMSVRSAGRVETGVQRHVSNPDIIVELRHGKIHGVRVTVHQEP